MKVIVNADDFGFNASKTDGIAESFRNGWITQTTLMVNMADAERAVGIAKQLGFADRVGLHFNITEGEPLSEEMRRSHFVGAGGQFNLCTNVNFRHLSVSERQALQAEARAQVARFVSFGLPLRHCDSHHHIHFKLSVARVLMPVLRDYGFKTIRRPYNVSLGWGLYGGLRHIRNALFASLRVRYGLGTTCWFGGAERKIDADSVEYMVHPCLNELNEVVNVVAYGNEICRPMKEEWSRLQPIR